MWLRDIDRWFAKEISPYEPQFTALAMRLCGHVETARDLVHDAYAQVLAKDDWRNITHPRAYVMRTIYNLGMDAIRRSRIVSMQQLAEVDTVRGADIDTAPDAFDAVSDREELSRVLLAIDRLPTQCRRVFIMRRIEDVPPRDIARKLGLSLSTVENHLARGAVLLADLLDEAEAISPRKPPARTRMTPFQVLKLRLLKR